MTAQIIRFPSQCERSRMEREAELLCTIAAKHGRELSQQQAIRRIREVEAQLRLKGAAPA